MLTTCPPTGAASAFNSKTACPAKPATGPPEQWLPKHVEDGATHAGNLAAGLYPTGDAADRARLCLSCHFGNGDRFVTHRIMGAGHPRLSFELDTFTAVEPAHFRIDANWEKRNGVWDGIKVWAIGQALIVADMMDVLADPKRGRDGLFPELVLFDCYACHHPMSDKHWAPRIPGPRPRRRATQRFVAAHGSRHREASSIRLLASGSPRRWCACSRRSPAAAMRSAWPSRSEADMD